MSSLSFGVKRKWTPKISWIAFITVFFTVFVFLSEWIQKTGIMNFPLGIRHITIVLTILLNWVLFGRRIRLPQYYVLLLFLMVFYLIIAFIFVPVTPINYILGTVFTFLFVVLFIFGSNTRTHISVIIRILQSLLVFFVIMSIGPIYSGLTAGTTLRDIPGMFRELGAFGSSMNIGVIISLSLYIITGEKKYIYFSVFLSFGVFLTILKKSIFSNIIVWIVFALYKVSARIRRRMFFYGIFFMALSFTLVGDEFKHDLKLNVDYYKRVSPTSHVRLGMYIAGYQIASDYFPFGSGMGTFGSLASIIGGYSKVHIDYGVWKIGSNEPQDVAKGHHTLLDTYWPHILAELGFIGTFIFLLVWLFPLFSTFLIIRKCDDPSIKGLGFYVILMVLIMSNEGLTLYLPEIPSFVLLHSGITGLCYYHIKVFGKSNDIEKEKIR